MSIKTTGIEFKEFYRDETIWTGESYYDDAEIIINNERAAEDIDMIEDIEDSDIIEIKDGYVIDHPDYHPNISLVNFFRKWKEKQTTRYIVIKTDKDQFEHSKQHIKNLGYQIKE